MARGTPSMGGREKWLVGRPYMGGREKWLVGHPLWEALRSGSWDALYGRP